MSGQEYRLSANDLYLIISFHLHREREEKCELVYQPAQKDQHHSSGMAQNETKHVIFPTFIRNAKITHRKYLLDFPHSHLDQ